MCGWLGERVASSSDSNIAALTPLDCCQYMLRDRTDSQASSRDLSRPTEASIEKQENAHPDSRVVVRGRCLICQIAPMNPKRRRQGCSDSPDEVFPWGGDPGALHNFRLEFMRAHGAWAPCITTVVLLQAVSERRTCLHEVGTSHT